MRLQLAQRDMRQMRQCVVWPHEGIDGRRTAIRHRDVALRSAAVGDGDVGLAAQQRLRGGLRSAHAQLKLHARILLAELCNHARQKLDGKARRAAHAHHTAPQALQRLNVRDHTIGLQRIAACVIRQHFARRTRHHATRAALEQRHAQQLFQRRNLATDCRRRHIQSQSGLAHRAASHDFEKTAQGRVLQLGGEDGGGSGGLHETQGKLKNLSIVRKAKPS